MHLDNIYPNDKERQEYYGRKSRMDSGIIAGVCIIALAGLLLAMGILEGIKLLK